MDMRPEYVSAGITVLKEELARIRKEEYDEENEGAEEISEQEHNSRVFLFSGYTLSSREGHGTLSAKMEAEVKQEIEHVLDEFDAGLRLITG